MVFVTYSVEWMDGDNKKSFGGMEMFHDPMSDSLMEHHGVSEDVFAVPFDLVVHRLTFMAAESATGDTEVKLCRDGSVIPGVDFTIDAEDSLPISFYSDSGFATFGANQTLQVALTNTGGSPGPENISVVVDGYRISD